MGVGDYMIFGRVEYKIVALGDKKTKFTFKGMKTIQTYILQEKVTGKTKIYKCEV